MLLLCDIVYSLIPAYIGELYVQYMKRVNIDYLTYIGVGYDASWKLLIYLVT